MRERTMDRIEERTFAVSRRGKHLRVHTAGLDDEMQTEHLPGSFLLEL